MKKLNREIILSNLAEAREQIEKIETRVKNGDVPADGELQIMFEHAYHHLNWAWNARRMSDKRYVARLSHEDFNLTSKFPAEIEAWRVGDAEERAAS